MSIGHDLYLLDHDHDPWGPYQMNKNDLILYHEQDLLRSLQSYQAWIPSS